MKKLLVTLIIVVILGLLTITCPGRADHCRAVSTVVNEAVNDHVSGAVGGVGAFLAGLFTDNIVDAAVDKALVVDNSFVFSLGRIHWDGRDHIVSVGVLNHIFTADSQTVADAVRSELDTAAP